MKTILILSMFTVNTAIAANWQPITDSELGTKLMVNMDSIRIDKYSKGKDQNGARIYAIMSYTKDKNETSFASIIDAHECLEKNSGILLNIYNDGTKGSFYWSSEGALMYDAQGQWLCDYLIGVVKSSYDSQQNQKLNFKKVF